MLLGILIVVLVFLILYLYIQNNRVSVRTYQMHIPNLHPVVREKRIVFLSDTHFREKISHSFIDHILIQIEEINPDLILFGGDITHEVNSDMVLEHTKDFFSQLAIIAPTYVIYGNHDLVSPRNQEIAGVLKRAGAELLHNEATWHSFGEPGAGIWLMGLAEYEASLAMKEDVLSVLKLPEGSQNEPKILLAHHPQYFEKYLRDEKKRPNLVLSGHTHGGQVILPVVGGLFAPGQGVNPHYDFGLFASEAVPGSRLIITRGLGNSVFPFRVNNRPEIVTIEFE